jgi:hypothetical protein
MFATITQLQKQQSAALKEFNSRQTVSIMPYNPNAKQFTLGNGKVVKLSGIENSYNSAIFKSMAYMHYMLISSDKFAKKLEVNFNVYIPMLFEFINDLNVNIQNKDNVLKTFEANRVDSGCKPQSTGLREIKSYLNKCFQEPFFIKSLDDFEVELLCTLRDTKIAPDDEIESYTLNSWMSEKTWLRRDDIGVGSEIYSRLASPKCLINSFNITVEVGLLNIQYWKKILLKLFNKNNILLDVFCDWESNEKLNLKKSSYKYYKQTHAIKMINILRHAYHQNKEPKEHLKEIMRVIVFNLANRPAAEKVWGLFKKNKLIPLKVEIEIGLHKASMSASEPTLFSLNYLSELVEYANSSGDLVCPTSKVEHLFFQWIVSSLRVQTSDIPKLRLSDFNLIRKVNGSITHLDCYYFKGRSQNFHATECLSTSTNKGKALINFISERSANFSNELIPISNENISIGLCKSGIIGEIINILMLPSFKKNIDHEHKKNSTPSIFLISLFKIIDIGETFESYRRRNGNKKFTPELERKWLKQPSPIGSKFFGLSAIKNSAVHSTSDKFDPTKLLNFNSHTNETERSNYLTPANQEWQNNSGRITRAVMQDIHSNLYQFSDKEKREFRSEYTKACVSIENKKRDMLIRLKLLTGKEVGEVNEFGISSCKETLKGDLEDVIYLIDSPETVMKLKHYVSEVEKHYKTLLRENPDLTFNTILPTVEWIEDVFYKSRFSTSSYSKGKDLFNKYGSILPPIFQANGAG